MREAKALAMNGGVGKEIFNWLFPQKARTSTGGQGGKKQLAKESPLRYSNRTPPLVLDREVVEKAIVHLTKNDAKLGALIARVGAEALIKDFGTIKPPTQARLFDKCLRAITFTMVSVDAGGSFLRRLAIKIGVCLENRPAKRRNQVLLQLLQDLDESDEECSATTPDEMLQLLLEGRYDEIKFTHSIVGELVKDCEVEKKKRTGYPHICGVTFPCGKNDDPQLFLDKAREHARLGDKCKEQVSAGFSSPKASFILSLVQDFESNKISASKIAKASDREAIKMLTQLKGIGDWGAGEQMFGIILN